MAVNNIKAQVVAHSLSPGGDTPSPLFLNKKDIYQYSLNGRFIKKWESIADIRRELGYSSSILSRCLLKQRKSNNAYNSQWFYKYKGLRILPINKGKITAQRKVRLYNSTEEHIFNSREACAKYFNVKSSQITNAINKKWKFKKYIVENYGN